MLNVRITNCVECANIQKLLKAIDCQISIMANNLFTNMIYMLDTPVNALKMSSLIHYKRILTYIERNPLYLEEVCFDKISSKINFLTSGCKCCDEYTVAHTTTSTTTTTTTTLPEEPLP